MDSMLSANGEAAGSEIAPKPVRPTLTDASPGARGPFAPDLRPQTKRPA